jgi:hypothetical protein
MPAKTTELVQRLPPGTRLCGFVPVLSVAVTRR